MRSKFNPNAGIFWTAFAIGVLILFYCSFGTVDIVYTREGKEFDRVQKVGVFTSIQLPDGDLTCTIDGNVEEIDNPKDLRPIIFSAQFDNFVSACCKFFNIKPGDNEPKEYSYIIQVEQNLK